ncbi:hypothetical protein D3C85_1593390 [compost metagenome]
MRRPLGNTGAVDQQVVVDLLVQGQRGLQPQVDQVQVGVPPEGDHPTAVRAQRVLDAPFQGEAQRWRQPARADQPEHQAAGFDPAQHGAGENGREVFLGEGSGHWNIGPVRASATGYREWHRGSEKA